MSIIKCGECGKNISDKAFSCPGCGAPVNKSSSQNTIVVADTPKSRSLSALFALFLGGLGIHKFYLNQPGWGFVYLVFCWSLIPSLVAFFEAINFILMSDETFQERY